MLNCVDEISGKGGGGGGVPGKNLDLKTWAMLFCTHIVPGIGTSFSLSVQPANNYPLDVYLLTDLSYSFLDDLTTLKALGARIGK